jgi:hypothetical protein
MQAFFGGLDTKRKGEEEREKEKGQGLSPFYKQTK